MKLLLQLYEAAAAGGAPSTPLEERCAAAGGVPQDLVEAFKAVLLDEQLDGAFKVVSQLFCSMNDA
jgi:aminopeptidase N